MRFVMDAEPKTREVEMKKMLTIILLCAFTGACSTQAPTVSTNRTLLSFNELATEITVGYEELAASTAREPEADRPLGTP